MSGTEVQFDVSANSGILGRAGGGFCKTGEGSDCGIEGFIELRPDLQTRGFTGKTEAFRGWRSLPKQDVLLESIACIKLPNITRYCASEGIGVDDHIGGDE
jgi:hypothetical protein